MNGIDRNVNPSKANQSSTARKKNVAEVVKPFLQKVEITF